MTELSERMQHFEQIIETASKFKKRMLDKKLKRARTTCPRCGGELYGSIAGSRNHFHMACKGACGMSMME